MDAYFLGVVSFIALLSLSGAVFVGAKKFNFPYTITLVAIGILLGILVKFFPIFGFLTAFELSKETLLYVFLPVLLFESAYNIKYREIIQHTRAISLLAVVGLVISAVLTAVGLYYILGIFGIFIPFLVLLAFGTLISATDPVAVLALFKEMWAPKRLTLIFEGESLFNDGTAIALLLVVLGILIHNPDASHSIYAHFMAPIASAMGSFGVFFDGFLSFVLMIVMGFLVGGIIGYGASRSILYISKFHILEIILTLVIAHATFLAAEWVNHAIIPVSPVIATTIAAMVMGNYGRYKLSAETRHMMGEYWEFFAFIANSLVFLLVGVMIVGLNIHFAELWLPILVSIFVVAASRAISVYAVIFPLNKAKKEFQIPLAWQHLLSWGSLRGGLAIIMALFIPADFMMPGWTLETSVRDFVLALTVGCIIFTTFVKATTIPMMLKKLQITAPSGIEKLDFSQGRILFLVKLLTKIDSTARRGYIDEEQKAKISEKYQKELDVAHKEFFAKIKDPKELENILERMLATHAIEIEKSILQDIFNHHEIPEWILRRMMTKLESQLERVEEGKTQIKEAYEHKIHEDAVVKFFEKILQKFGKKRDEDEEKYIKSRTRMIILEKVLKKFEDFASVEEIANSRAYAEIIQRYENMFENAKKIRENLLLKPEIKALEEKIVCEMLDIRKSDILENLLDSGLISVKTEKNLAEKYLSSY